MMSRHGRIIEKHRREINDIEEFLDFAEIVLRNNEGNEVGRAKIDLEDVGLCREYKWHLSNGYATSLKNEKYVLLHRIIMNAVEKEIVDHKNHDTLDNRKKNLRIVDSQINVLSRGKLSSNNTSGTTGVSWSKSKHKWKAYINISKKQIHIGYYLTFEEAKNARKVFIDNKFGIGEINWI